MSFTGEVFHVASAEGFTYDEATFSCQEHSARLASTGELYAAWKTGFDKCRAGWLLDHSVRYPINNPRAECGGGKSGVHTVYAHPNQASFPALDSKFDAYCFRGKWLTVIRRVEHFFSFSIINCHLILTVDLLLIANETGLNTTDIQEALLNTTLITDLLRPGEIY